MSKWFVVLTVAVCYIAEISGSPIEHVNVTSYEFINSTVDTGLEIDYVTDEPIISSISADKSTTEKIVNHIVASTFPPLVHNENPASAPAVRESATPTVPPAPPAAPAVPAVTSSPVTTVGTVVKETTKAPAVTHAPAKKQSDKKNASNIFTGNLLVLFLCFLASRYHH